MTFELLNDKEKEEYLKDAREAAKTLKEECSHTSILNDYCFIKKEICFYENQKECHDYEPRVKE